MGDQSRSLGYRSRKRRWPGLEIACLLLISFAPADLLAQGLDSVGFASARSVEGTLSANSERESPGALEEIGAWKKDVEARMGLSFGFDDQIQYLGTNSGSTPSDAAANAFRVYGTWTAVGRNTPDDGALVFKFDNRSAVGSRIATQALGPSLGYAGLFSSTFSDAGWVLTNFYWRQRFAGGRGSFVIGQVDVSDYVNVDGLANPWTAFTNLEFQQQSTFPAPSQGLGAALRWRIDENWVILGGIADANGDPSDPVNSAKEFFETGETFKHLAIGWTPEWGGRFERLIQLTFWQVDERTAAGVPEGHGVSFAASGRSGSWHRTFRAGYADGGGAALDRSVSFATAYEMRGGKDFAGLGVNWGQAPGSSRNQYTVEAFYRYDLNGFFQITPQFQYVANPVNDPATDRIVVLGLRLRAVF